MEDKINEINRLISEEGTTSDLYQELGKVYFENSHYEEALKAYKISLKRDDYDAWNYIDVENMSELEGQYIEARHYFILTKMRLRNSSTPDWCLTRIYKKLSPDKKENFYHRSVVKREPDSDIARNILEQWEDKPKFE